MWLREILRTNRPLIEGRAGPLGPPKKPQAFAGQGRLRMRDEALSEAAAGTGHGAETFRRAQRSRPTTIISALLGLMFGVLAVRADVAVGDPFPALAAAKLTGGDVPAIAGKVALVDFWASWCAPCKASFPAFARLHTDFASRGLAIVAISVDEKSVAYAAFVKKLQPPFVTLLDADHRLVQALKVPAMPTSYLIGRDGRVRFVHAGFHGAATEQELRSQIESLLAETAGTKS